MDRDEALGIARQELLRLRGSTYEELRPLAHKSEWINVLGPTGHEWRVQLHAVWDDGQAGGNLRIIAAVDDGRLRAFMKPLTVALILSPDGRFIGE